MCTPTEETSADLPVGVESRSRTTTQPGRTSTIPERLCQSFCSAQDLLLLPGFVSQSGKRCCSSRVGVVSPPRSEQKPQRNLLWYFAFPIKGVWTDLFTSHHRVRTHGLGHKEGLVHKRCAEEHCFSWGSPGGCSIFPAAVGHNPEQAADSAATCLVCIGI